jgi:hypothetical protein
VQRAGNIPHGWLDLMSAAATCQPVTRARELAHSPTHSETSKGTLQTPEYLNICGHTEKNEQKSAYLEACDLDTRSGGRPCLLDTLEVSASHVPRSGLMSANLSKMHRQAHSN